jgi:CRP-like cAMP-binding protein
MVDLFCKNPSNRSQRDLQVVAAELKSLNFFSERGMQEEAVKDICQVMRAKKFNAGSYIFHKDDDGDEFYFVIEGYLEVYVPVGP